MITKSTVKATIVDVICMLYILLFVYAAVNKLLDFKNFRMQLGQSPLLSSFAGSVAWMVPLIELGIAILLVVPRFKAIALYLGYLLMCTFTAYIYIILNYSSYIPCSCGGILEKLGWTEHLIFNMAFVLIAAIAMLLQPITDIRILKDTKL